MHERPQVGTAYRCTRGHSYSVPERLTLNNASDYRTNELDLYRTPNQWRF